jgi:hypothetical protein
VKTYLKVSAKFTLKDLPNGYLGLRGTTVHFGWNGPIKLWEMCAGIISNILDWYLIIDPTDETINENIKRLIEWLETVRVEPVPMNEDEANNQMELEL